MPAGYTAVSRKVVLQTGKSLRDNVVFVLSLSFLLNRPKPQSSKAKLVLPINANRHCHVRFYTFVEQPLSKQQYMSFWRVGSRENDVNYSQLKISACKRNLLYMQNTVLKV